MEEEYQKELNPIKKKLNPIIYNVLLLICPIRYGLVMEKLKQLILVKKTKIEYS
jgi:hypothetical protein